MHLTPEPNNQRPNGMAVCRDCGDTVPAYYIEAIGACADCAGNAVARRIGRRAPQVILRNVRLSDPPRRKPGTPKARRARPAA